MKETFKLKKDQYTSNRGGYSEVLKLSCRKCGTFITHYQKDGPGELLRTYIDRMIDPVISGSFEVDKKLICPHCKRLLGLGYIYPKEKRPAYILFQNTIVKKPTHQIHHLWCLLRGLFKK